MYSFLEFQYCISSLCYPWPLAKPDQETGMRMILNLITSFMLNFANTTSILDETDQFLYSFWIAVYRGSFMHQLIRIRCKYLEYTRKETYNPETDINTGHAWVKLLHTITVNLSSLIRFGKTLFMGFFVRIVFNVWLISFTIEQTICQMLGRSRASLRS